MNKVTGYEIAASESLFDLRNIVNGQIRNGWTPSGGISVIPPEKNYDKQQFVQALVKFES